MSFGDVFERPRFTLVIAEDEPRWSKLLKACFDAKFEAWGLAATRQFHWAVETAGSVESAKAAIERALAAGHVVYATIDLYMPLVEGSEDQDPRAGEVLADHLFDLKEANAEVAQRLEFCFISGNESGLDHLNQAGHLTTRLKQRRVRAVGKPRDLSNITEHVAIRSIFRDIKPFIRRHLTFCTFQLEGGRRADEHALYWVGRDPALHQLLDKADAVSEGDICGLHLLFTRSDGQAADWFRLVASLRRVEPVLIEIEPKRNGAGPWEDHLREPPDAMLVSRLDHAFDADAPFDAELSESRFFERLRDLGRLACFQFPWGTTAWDIVFSLNEEIERETLLECLRHVYGTSQPEPGIGFAFVHNDRAIPFPSFDVLARSGGVDRTIEWEVRRARHDDDPGPLALEGDIAAVLSGYDWPHDHGLDGLRDLLGRALRRHRARVTRDGWDALVRRSDFPRGAFMSAFSGVVGFRIRGRRLFDLLRSGASVMAVVSPEQEALPDSPSEALSALETLLALFDGLDGLKTLHSQLSNPFDQSFPMERYNTLLAAHRFLEAVCGSPAKLRHDVDEFRLHARSVGWKPWFPRLAGEREVAIESIQLSWPFRELRLHKAVDYYLQQNEIHYLIHRDVDRSMKRYTDLGDDWKRIVDKRQKLLSKVEDRELQRVRAEQFVRVDRCQPACRHLLSMEGVDPAGRMPHFQHPLDATVVYNTLLAACENHHIEGGPLIPHSEVKRLLQGQTTHGRCIDLLEAYCDALAEAPEVRERSLFRFWTPDWPVERKQRDAVRLAGELGEWMLEENKEERIPLTETHLDLHAALAKFDDQLPPVRLLDSLTHVRLAFGRAHLQVFWEQHFHRVWDLLRRFLVATTAPFRLGVPDSDGSVALWSHAGSSSVTAVPGAERWAGRLCVCVPDDSQRFAAPFPVDDLIRVPPDLGPRLFVLWNTFDWKDLLHPEDAAGSPLRPIEGCDWLPDLATTLSSPVMGGAS